MITDVSRKQEQGVFLPDYRDFEKYNRKHLKPLCIIAWVERKKVNIGETFWGWGNHGGKSTGNQRNKGEGLAAGLLSPIIIVQWFSNSHREFAPL